MSRARCRSSQTGGFNIEVPADRANSDFSANAAMAWARIKAAACHTTRYGISLFVLTAAVAGPGF